MSASAAALEIQGEHVRLRLRAGQPAIDFEWLDTSGSTIRLSDYRGQKVLLAFYRFALCPFCNLRLQMLARQVNDLEAKGLKIIAFIQSPPEAVAKIATRHKTPFPILPDYDRVIYRKYGLSSTPGGMRKAMLWRPIQTLRALLRGYFPLKIEGDPNLLPAEFLINPDGTIHTAFYGKDAGDHLPFERLRSFAGASGAVTKGRDSV